MLEWLGNSPDLNPIENSWAIIKQRLRGIDCTTMEKLIQSIIQLWYKDPQITQNREKRVDSMSERVKQLLERHGTTSDTNVINLKGQ